MKIREFPVLAAEALALILVFLLPLKFGTIIGLPTISLTYHAELLPLCLSGWPVPYFLLLSTIFLALSLFVFRKAGAHCETGIYAVLLFLLAGSACIGMLAPDTVIIFHLQYISYCFGLAAFGMGLVRLLDQDKDFSQHLITAIFIGFLFSMYSGFSQYYDGFNNTLAFLEKMHGHLPENTFDHEIRKRLLEQRISGDFSSCNAYAGYLVLMLPVIAAFLWRFGRRVEPARLARPLITIPIMGAALFLFYKTGSRGALLSLGSALILIFLFLPIPKKWKIIPGTLIPLGLGGMAVLIFLGRGSRSILFRLDYFQGALRIFRDHLLTGIGWGRFQEVFFAYKLFLDKEAPASPHNILLTFADAAGLAAFLLAAALLIFPLWIGLKRLLRRTAAESFSDQHILETAMITGLLAWTFQALMDILFETPGSMGMAVVIAILILADGQKKTLPVLRKILLPVMLLAVIVTALFSLRYLRYDFVYSQLSDLADVRMVPPEKLAGVSPESVRKLHEKCAEAEPLSPFHDMLYSDYLLYLQDPDGALAAADRALAHNAKSAALHARKARILKIMQRTDEAEAEIREARKLAPKNPAYQQ